MPGVLIVPPRLRGDGPHTKILREAGFEIRVPPPGPDTMQEEVLAAQIGDAEAIVAGTEPYTRKVIFGAPRLRVIVRSGVGCDAIDVKAAEELGVVVATTPGVNHIPAAEHALAMLLALARGFPRRDRQVRGGDWWTKLPLPRFAGRTLGIVGLGRIGRELATRAIALGLKVLASSPRPDREFAAKHGIEIVPFEDLLRESDMVSLHAPMIEATRGMINRRTLALMKPGAILVNTARGGLVVEEDLYAALIEGRLAAAGLDVFVTEPPPPDHPLLQLDNVLVSQHISGLDDDSYHDAQVMLANIIVDLSRGRWPVEGVVNFRGVTAWKW